MTPPDIAALADLSKIRDHQRLYSMKIGIRIEHPPSRKCGKLRKCKEKAPPFRAGMNPTMDYTNHAR